MGTTSREYKVIVAMLSELGVETYCLSINNHLKKITLLVMHSETLLEVFLHVDTYSIVLYFYLVPNYVCKVDGYAVKLSPNHISLSCL